jgi:hypothetical protein
MTLPRDLFDFIVEELEQRDVEFSVDEMYSGRGMFGDCCVGFSGDNTPAVMFYLGNILAELKADDNPNESWTDWLEDNYHGLCDAFTRATADSLGKGTIVYFKGLKVENP